MTIRTFIFDCHDNRKFHFHLSCIWKPFRPDLLDRPSLAGVGHFPSAWANRSIRRQDRRQISMPGAKMPSAGQNPPSTVVTPQGLTFGWLRHWRWRISCFRWAAKWAGLSKAAARGQIACCALPLMHPNGTDAEAGSRLQQVQARQACCGLRKASPWLRETPCLAPA